MWPLSDATDVRSYYDQGMQAYKDGKEIWQCPYVDLTSPVNALVPWMAGWMFAKQMDVQDKLEK
jgi:hypothetical protein